ncbi:MAG: methylmalonyl-CoA epimerase [Deltaproteobacteria bacterium]|nr:methylmalonyl-CoA epimerase [Deltaproteobacteria bacterium]MCL5277784.1 methylmalonyl-CoA epimerase [Deltaproteobacteria bacterium]
MKLDHVAIAVRDLDHAISVYSEKLGLHLKSRQVVDAESVEIAIMELDNAHVELVRPLDSTGGVARFLEKRGEGLHHICLEVEDMDTLIASLHASGVRLLDAVPRTGYKGNRAVFVHPSSTEGVLIEFYEKG